MKNPSWRKAILAVGLGIACLLLCQASLRAMCGAAGITYRSRLGFTFLFRLKFLGQISPEERDQLLEAVAVGSKSEEVHQFADFLRQRMAAATSWPGVAIIGEANRALVPLEAHDREAKFDAILNQTAQEFLLKHNSLLLKVAVADFRTALATTPRGVFRALLQHTNYFFYHRDSMPACAPLRTFTAYDQERIGRLGEQYYLRYAKLPFQVFLAIWLGTLLSLSVWRGREKGASMIAFAVSLTVLGLAMTAITCVLTPFQPRYTLPMWELAWISEMILLARVVEKGLDRTGLVGESPSSSH